MIKSFRIFGRYIYISDVRMRRRGGNRRDYDVHRQIKGMLYHQQGGVCPICGQSYKYKEMELHHRLPYAIFGRERDNPDNCVLLCNKCHNYIHTNPFELSRSIIKAGHLLGYTTKQIKQHYGNERPTR